MPQQSANSNIPHAHTVQAHTPMTSVPVHTGSAQTAKAQTMGAAYRGCPETIKYKQQIADKNQKLKDEYQVRLDSAPKTTKQQQPTQQQTAKQISQTQATNTSTNTMDMIAPRIAEAIIHALNDPTFRTLGHNQQKDTLINILNNKHRTTHTPTDTQLRSPACKTALTYAEATAKTPERQTSNISRHDIRQQTNMETTHRHTNNQMQKKHT